MADRLTRALAEIQAVLEEQRHEREEAVRQVAELEVSLDAARSQASERERSLMDANSRLLGQVEELSATVARMQAQIVDLMRSANTALVARGSSSLTAAQGPSSYALGTPFPTRASALPSLPASSMPTRHEYVGDLGRGEGFEDAASGRSGALLRVRLGGGGSSSSSSEGASAAAVAEDLDAMRMSPTGGLSSGAPRTGVGARKPSGSAGAAAATSLLSGSPTAAAVSHAAAAASSVALHAAASDLSSSVGGLGGSSGGSSSGGGAAWAATGGGGFSRPDMGAGSYDLQPTSAPTATPSSSASSSATSSSSASTAAAASAAAAPMTTPAFFSLLTRSVAPSNLETLMHALSVFNQGKIGKSDLLGIAEQTLKVAPGGGATEPLPDLVAVFKRLVLRMA